MKTKRQLPSVCGVERKFRLRWRLEYKSGKVVYGMWDQASKRPEEMAVFKNTTGLAWAVIEGEDIITHQPVRIVEVAAHVYECFQWIGAVKPAMRLHAVNSRVREASYAPDNIGLQIITRKFAFTVTIDGNVRQRARSAQEQAILLGNV